MQLKDQRFEDQILTDPETREAFRAYSRVERAAEMEAKQIADAAWKVYLAARAKVRKRLRKERET